MKKILLAGGGTLGPATPLLAVVKAAEKKDWQFVWVGTRRGPERQLVNESIPYYWVVAAKFDRFISLQNLFAPLLFIVALLQSFYLLLKLKPNLIVSAGGFNAVPVGYAGFILRIPILVHEQDVQVGLANKLLRPVAIKRTCVFGNVGAEQIGNLSRPNSDKIQFKKPEIFTADKPYILVTGGGTGATSLNKLVIGALPKLVNSINILHLTGRGKSVKVLPTAGYQQSEFLGKEMLSAMSGAVLVVTRAGMGTLSELASLSKPTIVVPIPHSHQVHNAELLKKNEAAIVLDQTRLTSDLLASAILEFCADTERQKKMGAKLCDLIPGGTEKFLIIIDGLLNDSSPRSASPDSPGRN